MNTIFSIYKIGIGPSSSHTVGPMKAGKSFADDLVRLNLIPSVTSVIVDIYGSLSLTGKGHHTDIAIILGLAGNTPAEVDIESIPALIQRVKQSDKLPLHSQQYLVDFPIKSNMVFHASNLPYHENGMTIRAFKHDSLIYEKTYYSVGGGEIVDGDNLNQPPTETSNVPYPFYSAEKLLQYTKEHCLSISSIVMKNELVMHSQEEIFDYFTKIWQVMQASINKGMNTEGVLPGPLKVPRRACSLNRQLIGHDKILNDPMFIMDWVNMYAMAVNEENAAGGRIVTAPTNGACGIIPAVLSYYDHFIQKLTPELYTRYFLTSGAIGMLYKMNASISGAEVGCQGEVGVACSMAAAGLAELMGGSPAQVCIAAEIAMEHNLGLTCDPVAGQVQVPCIERNAIAAVKAINAARMAIRRISEACVSLDKVIETMYETGKDMNAKYRETSQGGLAIKVLSCE